MKPALPFLTCPVSMQFAKGVKLLASATKNVLHVPSKLVCAFCKDQHPGRAEWCCHHCNGHSLCTTCSMNHRQAGHNITPLVQDVPQRSQCSNHVNVQANFLCSCGVRLCNNCVSLHAHGGNEAAHNRKSFGTLADLARQKLNSLKTAQHRDSLGIQKVAPTLAQNKKLVREMAQRARTAVASEVVELCNALMRRGNDIVTAIDMVEDAKLKQYSRTESDLKFAQDRLKKIEFFIDMATTSMPHDPPGIVSANVFAESAYNLFGSKWEQIQRGLEISQRTPNIQYFSDLPPIVNSLRTLGQLDVDGVVKTPSSATQRMLGCSV
uniref:Uncharacterized protein n=1 Tax=Ditylenchus dipsaci TaxID=166011 RepID=A0A915DEB7_9BILA